MSELHIGVLAVQGDFDSHAQKVEQLVAAVSLIRNPSQLAAVDGLIIPGGESTVFLRLLDQTFRSALQMRISSGLPTLATCAGSIILAEKVENPEQESLAQLSAKVIRNSYGRQTDSFITKELRWAETAKDLLDAAEIESDEREIEGVFIRAPKFKETWGAAQALLYHNEDAVLLQQNNILAATFHPELSDENSTIHKLFLSLCASDHH